MFKKIFLCLFIMSISVHSFASEKENDLNQIKNYLSSNSLMATFHSEDKQGISVGTFEYIPGHLKIIYTQPKDTTMIADKDHLYFHEGIHGSTTRMKISNQPLGIFLSNDIRKWNTSNPVIQKNKNVIQASLANSYGVVAMNFIKDNYKILPYSIDIKDYKNNLRHIQFHSIQNHKYDIHNFDIPKEK